MPPKRGKPLFKPRTLVLAKMQGFPAWPSFVMPEDMIPENIVSAKKKTTEYCVIFIPDGDFYWMSEKSLEELTPEELGKRIAKLPKAKKKGGSSKRTLVVGDALNEARNLDFDDFMKRLNVGEDDDDNEEDAEEDDVDDEEDEEQEVEEEDGDQDEDEVDDMVGADVDSDTPKSASRSLRREARPSSRRGARGRSVPIEENDKDDEDDEDDELPEDVTFSNRRKRARLSTPLETATKRRSANGRNDESKLQKKTESVSKVLTEDERQHQLWLCRIKLQRLLIQRNQSLNPDDPKIFPPPTVDELLIARLILHRLAEFPMTLELLGTTKIHKVLKCILKDPDLEYPDSFKLHDKCNELLDKWLDLVENLRQEKHRRGDSRLNSQAPDDSEISGIESVKKEGETDSDAIGIAVTTAS